MPNGQTVAAPRKPGRAVRVAGQWVPSALRCADALTGCVTVDMPRAAAVTKRGRLGGSRRLNDVVRRGLPWLALGPTEGGIPLLGFTSTPVQGRRRNPRRNYSATRADPVTSNTR